MLDKKISTKIISPSFCPFTGSGPGEGVPVRAGVKNTMQNFVRGFLGDLIAKLDQFGDAPIVFFHPDEVSGVGGISSKCIGFEKSISNYLKDDCIAIPQVTLNNEWNAGYFIYRIADFESVNEEY